MSRRLLTVALLLAAAVSLEACGRKGAPIKPEGAEFPRTYPQGAPDREIDVFREIEYR